MAEAAMAEAATAAATVAAMAVAVRGKVNTAVAAACLLDSPGGERSY